MIVWVISDDSYRSVQALEVAKRLAPDPSLFSAKLYDDQVKIPEQRPWPDVVIGAGEGTAETILLIKNQTRCYTAIVLDPRKHHPEFDLIILPGYEPYPPLPNSMMTIGLINRINPEMLSAIRDDFSKNPHPNLPELGLKPPYLIILVGGKHVGGNIAMEDALQLAASANEFAEKNNASILVATCNRTEHQTAEVLKNSLRPPNFFYEYNGARDIPNPYDLFLALADVVLVTGDSARMCPEAASSGKPVFIYSSDNIAFRYKKLHEELFVGDYARPYLELNKTTPFLSEKYLDEAGRVAEFIQKALIRI